MARKNRYEGANAKLLDLDRDAYAVHLRIPKQGHIMMSSARVIGTQVTIHYDSHERDAVIAMLQQALDAVRGSSEAPQLTWLPRAA
jgi:hypothetical protein